MSQPYIGEIRIFAGNFAPQGWALCSGQLLQISQNDTLFALIGTTYGGDGQTTFALPNLQSRVPIHQGTGPGGSYAMAQTGGVEQVTLTSQQIPNHTHAQMASRNAASGTDPTNNVIGQSSSITMFRESPPPPNQALNAATLVAAGGNQPHNNIQPYNVLNYIIALFGVFPSQN